MRKFFSPVLFGRAATDDAVRRTGIMSRGRHMEVVDNFDLASDKKHDVTTIINALERYTKGQINETVEHHNLLSRVQQFATRGAF